MFITSYKLPEGITEVRSPTENLTFSFIRIPVEVLKDTIGEEFLPAVTGRKHSVCFTLNATTGEGTLQVDDMAPVSVGWETVIRGQRNLSLVVDIFGHLI